MAHKAALDSILDEQQAVEAAAGVPHQLGDDEQAQKLYGAHAPHHICVMRGMLPADGPALCGGRLVGSCSRPLWLCLSVAAARSLPPLCLAPSVNSAQLALVLALAPPRAGRVHSLQSTERWLVQLEPIRLKSLCGSPWYQHAALHRQHPPCTLACRRLPPPVRSAVAQHNNPPRAQRWHPCTPTPTDVPATTPTPPLPAPEHCSAGVCPPQVQPRR